MTLAKLKQPNSTNLKVERQYIYDITKREPCIIHIKNICMAIWWKYGPFTLALKIT